MWDFIRDAFQAGIDTVTGWFGAFMASWVAFGLWLNGLWFTLFEAINPVGIVLSFAEWVLSFFPYANPDTNVVTSGALTALQSVSVVFVAADLFLHMPIFVACLGIAVGTETLLLISRTWRFIKSHVI